MNKTENRVSVFKNGTRYNGKVILIPDTFEELKETITQKLKCDVNRIFLSNGGEIDSINLIGDNDILYVSNGEDFLTPNSQSPKLDWLTLNVGGKLFTTSKSTLTRKEPASMLARMFAEDQDGFLFTPSNVDKNGAYLIDRSPEYFEPVLNYLRVGQLIYDSHINPLGILEEARFFGVESLVPILEQTISEQSVSRDAMPLSRRDVVEAIIRCPSSSELRFQGVNLAGADLSKLDLRFINFKFANMQRCKLMGSNLSWCCLERADLSHAVMDGAQLLGVKSLCANMENASLKNCNFEDPGCSRANMEGVNLKGANLEGSDMAGVNLRVATLKNAILKNCDCRSAIFAGADLESCDLSGSDLQDANLRGTNLKDAIFDLMLTPLHMSQTVR